MNDKDSFMGSLLGKAILYGRTETVELLRKHGAKTSKELNAE